MNNGLFSERLSTQHLLSYRARILSDLASDLLSANAIDVTAGRLIRDELRSIAAEIQDLEPDEELPLSEVLQIHENKMARRVVVRKTLDAAA
jgi:exonuclease V gamma subunit